MFKGITMNKKSIIIAAIIIIFALSLTICHKKPSIYRYSRILLGTVINITIISDSEDKAVKTSEQAFMEIERIENLMSPYRTTADIYKLNKYAYKRSVKVSEETFSLIKKSYEISEITNGSYDITFASLSHIWNFKKKDFSPPSEYIVNKLLPSFDYHNLILDPVNSAVEFRKKATKIGLGGIAKGYAIKKGIHVIRKAGIKNAILEAGGDVQVLGDKYNQDWKIGLRHPRKDDLILSIGLKDMDSIATSGDYERFRMYRGKRYHHILNPKTGFPAETFSSVSVISKDPTDADIFATAFFVMGKVRAIEFLKQRKDLTAIFVDLNLECSASGELKGRINLFNNYNIKWF